MVSPELIRRFPIFSGLTIEQIVSLAKAAEEKRFDRDHYFHHEGDEINAFYLLLDGEVAIVSRLPEREREIIIHSLGVGDAFGWSAFVPPFASTAGAKAITPCNVIVFDAKELRQVFEADCQFGYVMMQKIAMIIRARLNTLRIETLAYSAG
jgi:CRP/FNR family transcriptional regulator, cyclic AMP receptor protein